MRSMLCCRFRCLLGVLHNLRCALQLAHRSYSLDVHYMFGMPCARSCGFMMSLCEVLSEEGVSEARISALTGQGWTLSSFATVVPSLADFDGIWDELLPGDSLNLLEKAQIRAAWKRVSEKQSASSSTGPQPGPTAGWSEPFAPKLEGLKISELKKSFLSNFPSEVLTPATTPSTRLLSLAAHQHSKGDVKWIPWKFRMSQERADELQIQRPAKVAKLDALSLHDLLVDEPPAIEVNNSNMGLGAVRNLLAVHDTALAMVGSAHLARLKALGLRFLHFMSQRFEAESHLRAPAVLEAQQAEARV